MSGSKQHRGQKQHDKRWTHAKFQRIRVSILGLKPIRFWMPAFQRIRLFHTRSSINQSCSISTFWPMRFLVTRNSTNQMISLLNFRWMEVFQGGYLANQSLPMSRSPAIRFVQVENSGNYGFWISCFWTIRLHLLESFSQWNVFQNLAFVQSDFEEFV